jgi:hypothetical protein
MKLKITPTDRQTFASLARDAGRGGSIALDPIAADRLLVRLLLALYLLLLVRTAWTSDDAFITLRTVENFLGGDGLTWNTFERVQAYTHPLWMLALIPFGAVLEMLIPPAPDMPSYEALYMAHFTLSMHCMGGMLALLLWHFRRQPLIFAGFVFLPFAASSARASASVLPRINASPCARQLATRRS